MYSPQLDVRAKFFDGMDDDGSELNYVPYLMCIYIGSHVANVILASDKANAASSFCTLCFHDCTLFWSRGHFDVGNRAILFIYTNYLKKIYTYNT